MTGPASVVVLDMDGVILKSNSIKHRMMLDLFSAYPASAEAIAAYIHANGGVARRQKIITILETILHRPATSQVVADYLAVYDRKLAPLLVDAPLVDGVAAFVSGGAHRFYVSSTAPEPEIESQMTRTGLLAHFAGIYGRDTPKAVALREIRAMNPACDLVFFGDSSTDYEAAQETGAPFVAVTSEDDNFPDLPVVKLKDFSSKALIQAAMRNALAQRAD